MTLEVIAQAPTRVDLAGGTLDLWPIAQLLPLKATVNLAIGLPAQVNVTVSQTEHYSIESIDQNVKIAGTYVEITENKNLILFSLILKNLWSIKYPALNISARALSPAGAGLGGSSCLAVTLIAAIFHLKKKLGYIAIIPDENQLVRTAQDIEAQIIHAPTGVQDYWGAVRGGLNILTFPPGGEQIETLDLNAVQQLTHSMLVCYSGQSRASAVNNWEIFKRAFDRDRVLIATLTEMGETAWNCAESIKKGEFDEALKFSKMEWNQRVKLWPGIQTEKTQTLDRVGQENGSSFSRVCGAGGGGVMIFFAPVDKVTIVKNALTQAGGIILNCTMGTPGLTVKITDSKKE